MALHPEMQAKAQAEIDAVIGNSRLPTISDRAHLPYVNAVINEILRYGDIVPQGVPHRMRTDDVHEGYLIPKDSWIITNIWCVKRKRSNMSLSHLLTLCILLGSCPVTHARTSTQKRLTQRVSWVVGLRLTRARTSSALDDGSALAGSSQITSSSWRVRWCLPP